MMEDFLVIAIPRSHYQQLVGEGPGTLNILQCEEKPHAMKNCSTKIPPALPLRTLQFIHILRTSRPLPMLSLLLERSSFHSSAGHLLSSGKTSLTFQNKWNSYTINFHGNLHFSFIGLITTVWIICWMFVSPQIGYKLPRDEIPHSVLWPQYLTKHQLGAWSTVVKRVKSWCAKYKLILIYT